MRALSEKQQFAGLLILIAALAVWAWIDVTARINGPETTVTIEEIQQQSARDADESLQPMSVGAPAPAATAEPEPAGKPARVIGSFEDNSEEINDGYADF